MKPTDEPVIVEQSFNVSVDALWKAITEPEQMREWFFSEMQDFQPVEGFETRFTISHDGKDYSHCWKLIEVVPEKRIVYDWRYEGISGRGLVEWNLVAVPDGSQLKLTNTVVEPFPDDDPAFQRESCEFGWKYLIQEQLPAHLT